MSDVFISYSRTDKLFMARLHQALVDRRLDAWVDWEDIPKGARWLQEIYSGIERADTLVCIISPDWLASENCNLELAHALKHNKRVVPVIYREVEIENIAGRWFEKNWEQIARANWEALKSINWLFLRDSDDFEQAIQALIDTLHSDQEHVKAHTRYLVRAVEWDAESRKPEMLLRGAELLVAEQWLITSEGKQLAPTSLQREYIAVSRQAEEHRKEDERRIARRVQNFRRTAVILAIVGILAIVAALLAGLSASSALNEIDHANASQTAAGIALDQAETNVEQANSNVDAAETRVAFAYETLTPIAPTLTFAGQQISTSVQQAENANQQAVHAQTQVMNANYTLTPVGLTLTVAAATVDYAFEQVNEANQLAAGAQTQAAHAEETLTPVPLTITPLYATLNAANEDASEARLLAENAWQTLTPIPLTQTPIQQTMVANIEQLDNLQATGTIVAQEIQEQRDFTEALRLVTLAEQVLRDRSSYSGYSVVTGDAANPSIESYQFAMSMRNDPGTIATLLAIRSLGIKYTPEADMLLQNIISNVLVNLEEELVIDTAALSPDEHYLLVVERNPYNQVQNTHLFDLHTGETTASVFYGEYINRLTFSPDGQYIATIGAGDLKLWNSTTFEFIYSITGLGFQEAIFSPNGEYLLTFTNIYLGGNELSVQLFNVNTGQEIRQFVHDSEVRAIAFAPNGEHILTGDKNGIAHMWEVETGVEAQQFIPDSPSNISSVAFSPDGQTIAVANSSMQGIVRFWNVEQATELFMISNPNSQGYSSVFSHDGHYFISGGDEFGSGVTRVWDMTTRKVVRTIPVPGNNVFLLKHQNAFLLGGYAKNQIYQINFDYRDYISYVCQEVPRDFSDLEHATFGTDSTERTCPGLGVEREQVLSLLARLSESEVISDNQGELVFQFEQISINLTDQDNITQWKVLAPFGRNFVLGATVEWESDSEEDECGFIFRHFSPADADYHDFYAANIDRLGFVWFKKLNQGVWQEPIANQSQLIQTGADQTNDLVLVAVGDTFTILINGNIAADFHDDSFTDGELGLIASTFDKSDIAGCNFTDIWLWDLAQ